MVDIYIDGASKGNPGPAGIGVIFCQNGEVIKNISSYIGVATNNIAEYTALIWALQEALVLKADSIKINTDSLLLYNQIRKVYKIKSPNILGLYNQVLHLIMAFNNFQISYISRKDNRGADKLATRAVKEAVKK